MSGQRNSRSVSHRTMQEYLSALAEESNENSSTRHKKLLYSFAELQFKLTGGGKCSMCRAHVRHVVPVISEREDGTTQTFDCLCTRCLEAEKVGARVVTLNIGDAVIRYTSGPKLHATSEGKHKSGKRAAIGKR